MAETITRFFRVADALSSLGLSEHADGVLAIEPALCDRLLADDQAAARSMLRDAGIDKLGHRLELLRVLNERGTLLKEARAKHSRRAEKRADEPPAPRPQQPRQPAAKKKESASTMQTEAHRRLPAAMWGRVADEHFGESSGLEYAQRHVMLVEPEPEPAAEGAASAGRAPDDGAHSLGTAVPRHLARPPSPGVCIFPTASQADALANVFTSRGLSCVSIGAGGCYLEAMLRRRGVAVTAVDVSLVSENLPDEVRSQAFCSEVCYLPAGEAVRRVRPEELFRIEQPATTALLFSWGRALPWRAYLSRYGGDAESGASDGSDGSARRVPLVAIVGDPDTEGLTEPASSALDPLPGWRRAERLDVRGVIPEAEVVVYERVADAQLSPSDRVRHTQIMRDATPVRLCAEYRIDPERFFESGGFA